MSDSAHAHTHTHNTTWYSVYCVFSYTDIAKTKLINEAQRAPRSYTVRKTMSLCFLNGDLTVLTSFLQLTLRGRTLLLLSGISTLSRHDHYPVLWGWLVIRGYVNTSAVTVSLITEMAAVTRGRKYRRAGWRRDSPPLANGPQLYLPSQTTCNWKCVSYFHNFPCHIFRLRSINRFTTMESKTTESLKLL